MEVSDADREAGEDLVRELQCFTCTMTSDAIQAFARHRHQALSTQAAELDALRGEVERTLSDTQRLIWRDDVEGICPSLDLCFDYGGTVRCAPCAIKQSQARGVEPNMGLPNLPEVSRLRRKCTDHEATIAQIRDRVAGLEHIASDLLQHIDWLTHGLPKMLEDAALKDEEGLIGAAVDAANSARALLTQNEVG